MNVSGLQNLQFLRPERWGFVIPDCIISNLWTRIANPDDLGFEITNLEQHGCPNFLVHNSLKFK